MNSAGSWEELLLLCGLAVQSGQNQHCCFALHEPRPITALACSAGRVLLKEASEENLIVTRTAAVVGDFIGKTQLYDVYDWTILQQYFPMNCEVC